MILLENKFYLKFSHLKGQCLARATLTGIINKCWFNDKLQVEEK